MKRQTKCHDPILDALVLRRPGAFKDNVDLLLKAARACAKAGRRRLVLPADAVRGGDCGSLEDHR